MSRSIPVQMQTVVHEQCEKDVSMQGKIAYVIFWSIPQNKLAGLVVVIGTKEMSPVNLLESTPPKLSFPFGSSLEVVGTNDMPMRA